MAKFNFKKQPITSRIKEAVNLISGRIRAPRYHTKDLDRIVGFAMNRERVRQTNNIRNQSGYDAGRTGRVLGDWTATNEMPYTEVNSYNKDMRARSRDLYRNDATYRSAINTIVQCVVGVGLRPKPKVVDLNGKPMKEINLALENAFWKYSRRDEWDARRKMPFVGEGQRQALRTVLVSGDYFLNAVNSRDVSYLPVMWQQCEIDRLDNSYDEFKRYDWQSENVAQTLHGINLDEYGAPVSYRFKGVSSLVPAKNIIHVFMTDRPEQYAGVPAAASALSNLRTKHNIVEDYALKSEAIAKILWFLSNENSDIPYADDQDGDDILELDSLSQMRGEKAPEQLKFPDNINDTLTPLVRILVDGVCSVLGTSYTTVTRNMDGVNFAASKFIDIQEWRAFEIIKDWFVSEYCEPFYEKFVLNCVATGKISGISPSIFAKDPYRFYECTWTGNGKQDVDPFKDISADNAGLRTGITSLTQALSKRGIDFDEQVELIRTEREKLTAAGLEDIITAQADGTQQIYEEETPPEEKDEELPEEKSKPKSKKVVVNGILV